MMGLNDWDLIGRGTDVGAWITWLFPDGEDCGRGHGEYNHAYYSRRADDNRGVIEARVCRRYLLLLFDSGFDPFLRF